MFSFLNPQKDQLNQIQRSKFWNETNRFSFLIWLNSEIQVEHGIVSMWNSELVTLVDFSSLIRMFKETMKWFHFVIE